MFKALLPKLASLVVGASVLASAPVFAQKKYDVGASDTEVVIGNTMAFSGPASAYGSISKTMEAYFRMINDQGGVNGRKIRFIALDDGYSPPKTVEQVRRLVEQDNVLMVVSTLGTPTNTAIHKYMNARKVPHLFLATGASKWNDPKNFPWTMGWQPNYHSEGAVYAKHLLQTKPDAKIGILYQNDDYGKDYLKGFKDGLGDAGRKMIVSEVSYEVTDPTIDSQIVALKSSGADAFMNITTPKFAAMAIRKAYDIGWKPVHYLNNVSSSVASVMVPAGVEKGAGIISMNYLKDPNDKQWANDQGFKDWLAFMKKYYPDGDLADSYVVFGYGVAQTTVQVLKQAGDNLTRENIMKEAANLKNLQLPMALPGVVIDTSPTDFAPFQSMRLVKFDGKGGWELFGDVMSVK